MHDNVNIFIINPARRCRVRSLITAIVGSLVCVWMLSPFFFETSANGNIVVNTILAFTKPSENTDPADQRLPREAAGNETLGFEAILALSRSTQWRIEGLRLAGAYTGLDITVPPQSPIEPSELDEFVRSSTENSGHSLGRGSALAWMQHLRLLQHFLDSGYDTALILEDDSDWDVAIKESMKDLSDAVLSLTRITPQDVRASSDGLVHAAPYGHNWDLLWIGNCGGDASSAVQEAKHDTHRIRSWPDPSVVPHAEYIGWAKNAVKRLSSGHRAVFWATGPVCTYAYGVTQTGAQRVLDFASTGADAEAYDVRLSRLCREGTLRCLVVAPELVHEYEPLHQDGDPSFSEVNAGNEGEQRLSALDLRAAAAKTGMGETKNIVNSARCRALFDEPCPPVVEQEWTDLLRGRPKGHRHYHSHHHHHHHHQER